METSLREFQVHVYLSYYLPVKTSASSSNTACSVLVSPRFSSKILSRSCLQSRRTMNCNALHHQEEEKNNEGNESAIFLGLESDIHCNNRLDKPWLRDVKIHGQGFGQWHV